MFDDTLGVSFILSVDGPDPPRRLLPDESERVNAHSWSESGLIGLGRATHITLFDPETEQETDIPSTYSTSWGNIASPTGDAVAYTSGHTGEYHIYVQPLPPSGGPRQVSSQGGAEEPRWSADGRLLYYRSGRRIMFAPITVRPELILGAPSLFVEGEFVNVGGRSYDISRDGRRALIIDGGVGTTTTLNVIQGWLAEVEALIQEAEGSGADR